MLLKKWIMLSKDERELLWFELVERFVAATEASAARATTPEAESRVPDNLACRACEKNAVDAGPGVPCQWFHWHDCSLCKTRHERGFCGVPR